MYLPCFLCIPFLLLSVSASYTPDDLEYWEELAKPRLDKQLKRFKTLVESEKKPKNIILFIGDGMGNTAVTASRILRAELDKRPGMYAETPFFMETFDTSGLSRTSSLTNHVTDSAAGAVALLTGRKGEQGMLNHVPNMPKNCSDWENSILNDEIITELMLKRGGQVGVVTTTGLTHATPAATYAKGVHRNYEGDKPKTPTGCKAPIARDIASQLLQFPAKGFKVLMGAGAEYLEQKDRSDGKNIAKEWEKLDGNRKLLQNLEDLNNLEVKEDMQVLGVFAEEHISFREQLIEEKKQPHLANMTKKAIEILKKKNDNGFFLLVEGGRIDHAEHGTQMRMAIGELFEMDEAIKTARDSTDPEDTLIIVTADHSHAVALPGYRYKNESIFGATTYFDDQHRAPGVVFAAGKRVNDTIYTANEASKTDFVSPALVRLPGGTHGADDVPIYSDGPYSWLFSGSMENTEVAYRMKYLLCLLKDQKCEVENRKREAMGRFRRSSSTRF